MTKTNSSTTRIAKNTFTSEILTMTNSKDVISFLRFPMAALIVLLHADIVYQSDIPIRYDGGWANIVIITLSYGICQVAVPVFALISGYLFFGGLQCFQTTIWIAKIKRRSTSLFVPYILWNIIAFLWMIFYYYLLHTFRGSEFDVMNVYESVGGLRMFWDGWCNLPIDGPLWYIKNLMIIILLSPLLYVVIKYSKSMGVLVLGLLYVFNIWPSWHWFNIQVIFFFSLGAYYKLKDEEPFVDICRYRFYAYLLAGFSLLALLLSLNISPKYSLIAHHLFTIFGVISVFIAARKFTQYEKLNSIFCMLGASSFFVYAVHRFALIDLVKDIAIKLIPQNSDFALIAVYFVVAFSTFIICHCMFLVMKALCPRILSLLIGGRIITK